MTIAEIEELEKLYKDREAALEESDEEPINSLEYSEANNYFLDIVSQHAEDIIALMKWAHRANELIRLYRDMDGIVEPDEEEVSQFLADFPGGANE